MVWSPDWQRLAARIGSTLQLAPGERVVMLGDVCMFGELFEAVQAEILRRGAIHHATLPVWNGAARDLRTAAGRNPDGVAATREREAAADLLRTADVFVWLPHSFAPFAITAGDSEWVLARWTSGRGLHFHWFPDWYLPRDHPAQDRLRRMLEQAVLDLDYDAHSQVQARLLDAVRGASLRITTPQGTDLRLNLEADGWYHLNDGNITASKRGGTAARDREEELPCGSLRTIPVLDSSEGFIRYRDSRWVIGAVGTDMRPFMQQLDLEFSRGRVSTASAGERTTEFLALWKRQEGSYDRITEVVFGTNPHLHDDPDFTMPPYWGFGAGMVRLHTGDNTESGGDQAASLSLELFLSGATVTADGTPVIESGRLLV